ncbi:hypothetical protein AWENTII_007236 [Aspergillus wentii]
MRYETTALFQAAQDWDWQMVELLLQRGADPKLGSHQDSRLEFSLKTFCKSSDSGGPRYPPLHGILRHFRRVLDYEHQRKTLDALLQGGADINVGDYEGRTLLMQAVVKQADIAFDLLRHGADPNIGDSKGSTPLHEVMHGTRSPLLDVGHDPDMALLLLWSLLEHGASIYTRRKPTGDTPLHTFLSAGGDPLDLPPHPDNIDWNVVDATGNTPLHYAMEHCGKFKEECIKDLVDAGAKINHMNHAGQTPLHKAAMTKNLPRVLPKMLKRGAGIEYCDNRGYTVLLYALHCPYSAAKNVSCLVNAGADVFAIDNNGNGALHQFCRNPMDMNLFQQLIDAGCDIHEVNNVGDTLLHTIARDPREGSVQLARKLVELGLPGNTGNNSGQTPAHILCSHENYYHGYSLSTNFCMQLLGLETGIGSGINLEDCNGVRPIHLAASATEAFMANLINKGVDVEPQTHQGRNVLHIAAVAGDANMIGLVLEALGPDKSAVACNQQDDSGFTPLHEACRSGRLESVALLLQAGAQATSADKSRRTPLHICAEFSKGNRHGDDMWDAYRGWSGHSEKETLRVGDIALLLIKHGADMFATNERYGHTPIQHATKHKCEEMIAALDPAMKDAALRDSSRAPKYRDTFMENYLTLRRRDIPSLIDEYLKDAGKDVARLGLRLLNLGEYNGVEYLASRLEEPPIDLLKKLAMGGFTRLFEAIGRKFPDSSWINTTVFNDDEDGHETTSTFLSKTCERRVPNLDMIKVMVEVFGADVNLQTLQTKRQYHTLDKVTDKRHNGALHILAVGKHWWQTEAMPYLIERGADVDLVNAKGDTPLRIAIGGGYWRDKTVKLLHDNGANRNVRPHFDPFLIGPFY